VLHDATLRPTKQELLAEWVPRQAWYPSDEADFEILGRFRFDDPAGEVGTETFLLGRPDGGVFHVPLTYRGAPLDEPGAVLIGTMEHSALGSRWVYDGATDPVYLAAVAEAIRTGGHEAAQYVQHADGSTTEVPSTARAEGRPGAGSGRRLELRRALIDGEHGPDAAVLVVTWDAHPDPAVLAELTD